MICEIARRPEMHICVAHIHFLSQPLASEALILLPSPFPRGLVVDPPPAPHHHPRHQSVALRDFILYYDCGKR